MCQNACHPTFFWMPALRAATEVFLPEPGVSPLHLGAKHCREDPMRRWCLIAGANTARRAGGWGLKPEGPCKRNKCDLADFTRQLADVILRVHSVFVVLRSAPSPQLLCLTHNRATVCCNHDGRA